MIISRTPLRISFVGGGSDIASFYQKQPGAVVSTTIDKYIYITLNPRFDGKIRLSYSEHELVDRVSQLRHKIAKETLKFFNLKKGVEITSTADIPAGTGLGSSGAYTVGLLNLLSHHIKKPFTKEQLAEYASIIEIGKAKRPIGKQDQCASAYGGLNFIQFNPDESISFEPIVLSPAKQKNLQEQFLLFYTGKRDYAETVLSKQNKQLKKKTDKQKIVSKMVNLAKELKNELQKGKIDSFGELLHENWLLKKKVTGGISSSQIDCWYETARKKGAIGGKICGAGGRGFLFIYAPVVSHKNIIKSLRELYPVSFSFEKSGSAIVYHL